MPAGGAKYSMAEKDKTPVTVATPPVAAVPTAAANGAPIPPKRSPGHRGADVKDTVAEMAAKAHEISLEAGSKMAAAMKDVINAAAGVTGFAVESARDLVQYMVRRGQMTQDEANKLIKEAEDFQSKRKGSSAAKPATLSQTRSAPHKPAKPAKPATTKHTSPKPGMKKAAAKPSSAKKKPAAKATGKKPATKSSAKRTGGSKAKARPGRKK